MDIHLNTRKVIVMDADWAEQYAIRDQIIESAPRPTEAEAEAVHDYIMTAEAEENWRAEVEADAQEFRDVKFGSKQWFVNIEETPF